MSIFRKSAPGAGEQLFFPLLEEPPLLARLPDVPQRDREEEIAWRAEGAHEHPGRMRYQAAVELLRWAKATALEPIRDVADGFCGIGTTAMAAGEVLGQELRVFYGNDLDERCAVWVQDLWFKLVPRCGRQVKTWWTRGDAGEYPSKGLIEPGTLDLLLESPMFVGTHDQGGSVLQDHLRKTKSTYMGNASSFADGWRTPAVWRRSLERCVVPWIPLLRPGSGRIMLHLRDWIEKGKRYRADLVAVQCLARRGLVCEGRLIAPLSFRSYWKEMHTRPLHQVEAVRDAGPGMKEALLSCEHWIRRPADERFGETARCTQCERLEREEVDEEVTVVFRRTAEK